MATAQGYVQPIAQDAQQTIPNNGNPNTVYNVAPPGAAPPQGGWASAGVNPAANFSGGVNVGDAIAAGNEQVKTQGWAPPAPAADAPKPGQGMMTLPQGWAEEIKNFQPKTEEQAGGGTTTEQKPAYDLDKQWIVMDGNVPRKNANLYANDPAYRAAWDQIFAEHQSRMGKSIEDKRSDSDSMAQALRMYYQMYYDTNWRPDQNYVSTQGKTGNPQGANNVLGADYFGKTDPKGWARAMTSQNNPGVSGGSGVATGGIVKGIDLSTVAGLVTNGNGKTTNVGWNSDASKGVGENLTNYISNAVNSLTSNNTGSKFMEVLDRVTEPFLPGNLYMSELGKVNMPNVLAAVMNQVVPGLGTLGKWIADKIPQDVGGVLGKVRDFFQQGKFQEAANEIYKNYDMEQAQNQAISGGGGGVGVGGKGPSIGGGWSGNWGGGGGSSSGGYTITVGGSGSGGNNSSSSPGSNKKNKVVTYKEN